MDVQTDVWSFIGLATLYYLLLICWWCIRELRCINTEAYLEETGWVERMLRPTLYTEDLPEDKQNAWWRFQHRIDRFEIWVYHLKSHETSWIYRSTLRFVAMVGVLVGLALPDICIRVAIFFVASAIITLVLIAPFTKFMI